MTTRDPALQGGLFLLPLLLYLGKAAPRLLLTARPVLGMSFLSAGFIALFRTVIREQGGRAKINYYYNYKHIREMEVRRLSVHQAKCIILALV